MKKIKRGSLDKESRRKRRALKNRMKGETRYVKMEQIWIRKTREMKR